MIQQSMSTAKLATIQKPSAASSVPELRRV